MFALKLEDPTTIIEWFLVNYTAPSRDPSPPPEPPTTVYVTLFVSKTLCDYFAYDVSIAMYNVAPKRPV